MKKQIINIFLKLNIILIILPLVFSGCTKVNENQGDKIKVVAVNFAQYDFARAVCGEIADVKMIIRPGAEIHSYEPSLSDIISIENADVFVYGGGESDEWIRKILSSVDTSDMSIISCMDLKKVHLYEEEKHILSHEGHEHHHEIGSHTYDEHIWTSPKNAMAIVDAIRETLADADAKNSGVYEENAHKYLEELSLIDKDYSRFFEKTKNRFIAVADRFPFLYMAKDYGIEYAALYSGCSPESDAGPAAVAHMIEEVNTHGVNTVFHIELSNEKMADAVCEISGVKKAMLHSCQSISRRDFESGVTYAGLMEKNLENLKEAL